MQVITDYRLLTDEILIKLLKADDQPALKEIYNRYWKSLFLSALQKVRSREVAEELVENLLISLWNKRETASIQHLPCYLQAGIKYQVINYLQSKIIREKNYRQAMKNQEASEEKTSETMLLIHELSFAIEKATRKLPEKTQLVFRLSRFENKSVKEISAFLDISEKAVEYHITQSLRIMRLQLKEFILVSMLICFCCPAGFF
jgi:RNA polymerase sigma factor (sigma-70 family)